jgi:hypothetical protein
MFVESAVVFLGAFAGYEAYRNRTVLEADVKASIAKVEVAAKAEVAAAKAEFAKLVAKV